MEYQPAPEIMQAALLGDPDSTTAVVDLAYKCGFELKPEDQRSKWIDEIPSLNPLRENAVDAYHAGQVDRYENEDW